MNDSSASVTSIGILKDIYGMKPPVQALAWLKREIKVKHREFINDTLLENV